MLKINPPLDEWYPGQYAELTAAVEQHRRDDPMYDQSWREGLQRIANEWDARALDKVYRELARDRFFRVLNMQRTGDEPI